MIEFKDAKDLVGKCVRRTGPNKRGDYSFMLEISVIRKVEYDKIYITTLYGHDHALPCSEYDDGKWIAADHSINSTQIALMFEDIHKLQRQLKTAMQYVGKGLDPLDKKDALKEIEEA